MIRTRSLVAALVLGVALWAVPARAATIELPVAITSGHLSLVSGGVATTLTGPAFTYSSAEFVGFQFANTLPNTPYSFSTLFQPGSGRVSLFGLQYPDNAMFNVGNALFTLSFGPVVTPPEAPVGTVVLLGIMGNLQGFLLVPPLCIAQGTCGPFPPAGADFYRLPISAALQGTLSLRSIERASGNGNFWAVIPAPELDVIPTPEPASGALLLVGLGLVARWRRGRR
jgi:hypothetical protein